jgi:hypothetical protein
MIPLLPALQLKSSHLPQHRRANVNVSAISPLLTVEVRPLEVIPHLHFSETCDCAPIGRAQSLSPVCFDQICCKDLMRGSCWLRIRGLTNVEALWECSDTMQTPYSSQHFNFERQYQQQEQLYGAEGRPPDESVSPYLTADGTMRENHYGQQWALLRFSQPVVAPLVIVPHPNSCDDLFTPRPFRGSHVLPSSPAGHCVLTVSCAYGYTWISISIWMGF